MKEIDQDQWFAAGVRTMEAAEKFDDTTRRALERLAASYFWRGVKCRALPLITGPIPRGSTPGCDNRV